MNILSSSFTVLMILLMGLVGCVTNPMDPDDSKRSMAIWPKPPDLPRYIHEFTLRKAGDIQAKNPYSALIGDSEEEKTVFLKPMRVAAKGGRVYVTDSFVNRVHCFDVPRRRFFQFGFRLEGALKKPTGIAVDLAGFVYVADGVDLRVVVYDGFGMYHRAIGSKKTLHHPVAVSVSEDGNRIFVVDSQGVGGQIHRIVVFDKDGNVLHQFGKRGNQPGEFNMPTDVDIGPDGNLYILDAGNFRVQVLSQDGTFIRSWGSNGNGLGQFARPRDLAVDKDGLVYISDAMFGNIQIFDSTGQLLLPLLNRGMEDMPGEFALIAGIAVDETKRVYVLDQYFKKLEVFRTLSQGEGQAILAGTSPLLKLLTR